MTSSAVRKHRKVFSGTIRERRLFAVLLIFVTICLMLATFLLCAQHEPGSETVREEVYVDGVHYDTLVSDADQFVFVYTGEGADSVHWDFGDGTSASGYVIYKSYPGPGTFNVLCTAYNFYGSTTSGTQLVLEESHHGFLDGYDDELACFMLTMVFMIFSVSYAGSVYRNGGRSKSKQRRK